MFFTNTTIDLILWLSVGEGGGTSLLIAALYAVVLPRLFQWGCYDAS